MRKPLGMLYIMLAIGAGFALTACEESAVFQVNPTEVQVVEVPTIIPGPVQVVEVPGVGQVVMDTALVNRLLRIIGDIDRLECVDDGHNHEHTVDICRIIANGLRDLPNDAGKP